MANCRRIVLTGGPCGGKTTILRALRAEDMGAQHWLLVPEAAPLLFGAGLDGRQKGFQRAVVRLQIALEDSCADAAGTDQVIVCHRGTLDPLAYWLRNGWREDEFFWLTEMSRSDHLERYDAVIHVQTAAIGAEAHYRRWPDAHRGETIEEAAEIDHLCALAWDAHPCYRRVENDGSDWAPRGQEIRRLIDCWLT